MGENRGDNSAFSLSHPYCLPAPTGTGVRPARRTWGWARRRRPTATSGRTRGGQRPSTPPPPPPSPRLPQPPPPSTSPPTHWVVFRSFLFLSSILSHHPPCQCGVQYSRPQAVVFDLNRPRTEHCAASRSGNYPTIWIWMWKRPQKCDFCTAGPRKDLWQFCVLVWWLGHYYLISNLSL